MPKLERSTQLFKTYLSRKSIIHKTINANYFLIAKTNYKQNSIEIDAFLTTHNNVYVYLIKLN